LIVPSATGSAEFSPRRSNTQHEAKKLTDTTENTIKCLFIDNRGDFCRGQRAIETKEVCGETGNVRSGHGRSFVDVGLPARPGGYDVQAGSPDINGGTIVGEVGLRVIDVRSGDGDRLLNAGRRVVARVFVIVSGGYDYGDTAVVKLKMKSPVSGVPATFHPVSAYPFNGRVHSDRNIASYAHRSNRGITGPPYLVSDPVNAGNTVVR